MLNEKFKNHPYFSDHSVIIDAFNALMNEQKSNFRILRDYKDAICEESIEQLDWENQRIEEVKKQVLNKYFNA